MENNGECETSFLLRKTEKDDQDCTCLNDKDEVVDATESHPNTLNLKTSFIILTGLSFGTAVLVVPFTLRQLELLPFLLSLVSAAFVLCLCSHLLSKCIQHTTESMASPELIRDPYPAAAELSFGVAFRKVLIVAMYVSSVSSCIGVILLAATLLKDLIYLGDFSDFNLIRIWATIVISVITPIMYLGTYTDLQIPAIVALASSSFSLVAIITNCLLAHYLYDIKPDINSLGHQTKNVEFLLSIGTVVFVLSGPAITIPNIVVISSNPQKVTRAIICSYSTLFVIFLAAGMVPYFTLGENVMPSITSTFYAVIKLKKVDAMFKILTITIQVLMVIHLLMASILILNPCFLHIEEILHAPHEMNLKRIGVRTSVMLIILCICCLLPQFQFIIGISGGVPLTLIGIIFPIALYLKFFQLPLYKRIPFWIMLLFVIVFTISNFCSSVINLVKLL